MTYPILPASNAATGYNLTNSLRVRASASAYLNRTPATSTNRQTMGHSLWVKRGKIGVFQDLLVATNDALNVNWDQIYFAADDTLNIWGYAGTSQYRFATTQVFRDPSAWYHIYIVYDTTNATAANRVLLYVNGVQVTSFSIATTPAQNINTWFNNNCLQTISYSSNLFDGYIAEYNHTDGSAPAVTSFGSFNATTGVWQPAKYSGTYGTNGFYLPFNELNTSSYVGAFNGSTSYLSTLANGSTSYAFGTNSFTIEGWFNFSSNTTCSLIGDIFNTGNGDWALLYNASVPGLRFFYNSQTTATYITSNSFTPTVGTWYHFAVVRNGTTVTFYINGVASGSSTVSASITYVGTNLYIGAAAGITLLFPGSASNIRVVNGTAVYTSNFAPPQTLLTNISGTALLTLQNLSIVDNSSNAYTVTNNVVTTSLGYPFLGANIASDQSGNGNNWTTNNISLTAGSTYDSMTDVPTLTSATAANYAVLNPLDANTNLTITNGNLQGVSASTWYQVRATIGMNTGKWYWECILTSASPAAFFGIGTATASLANSNFVGSDAYGWSYYSPNGQKYNAGTNTSYGSSFTQNDVIGIAFDAGAGTLTFYKNNVSQGTAYTGLTGLTYFPMFSVSNSTFVANFGQQPFTYTPPTGFVALNAYNLPTGTILQGSTAMNATLQLGSAVATGATLFAQTGFTYGLAWGKDRTSSNNHQLVDTVRGTSNVIQSNTTAAETTYTAPTSTDNMVTWGWNAGSSAVTNTNGSITSTVSVNASAGFSVVTYTGTGANATVGHGLGVAPQFIFVKYRNGVIDWRAYHSSIGNTNFLVPNTNVASAASSATWNNTSPTSSVFSIGTALNVNNASANYVAYCWAAISGFSAFGSYTGNGSASGPFIYCGFQPKYILFKRTDSAESWLIKDTARNPYNSVSSDLYVDLANAEDSSWTINVTANGFQLTSTGAMNASGGTYIYAAFASNPFKNSLAF